VRQAPAKGLAAAALGLGEGDEVAIESRFGRVEGVAALSEGVHPDAVCVANALTRKTPRQRGTPFNALLPAELDYTDKFSGALESCARVRVRKLEEVAA
jgi:anaerobic selenocysteine-containing dehydrogenase